MPWEAPQLKCWEYTRFWWNRISQKTTCRLGGQLVGSATGRDRSFETGGSAIAGDLILGVYRTLTLASVLFIRSFFFWTWNICARCCGICDRDENTSRKELDTLGTRHLRWDKRIIRSLGDEESVDPKERVAAECQEENAMCEWSHTL